jgi:hypothetical protein
VAAVWTLELDVDVAVFDNSPSHRAAGDFPQKVMTGKVRLGVERSEPVPLAWYALDFR